MSVQVALVEENRIRIDSPKSISATLVMPRWLTFSAKNKDFIVDQIEVFLRGGGTWEDVVLKTEGDQILVRNGGNDFEPCLILQNTFDDGSSGGTLYVEESNGPEILTALAKLVSKEKA